MSRSFRILGFLLVLGGIAYAAVLYPSLPDPIASHWDARGQVNGRMPKPWGVWIVPIVMVLMWLLFMALPRISPKGFGMGSFAQAWGVITTAVLAFMLFVEILTLNAGRTAAPLSPRPIFAAIGLLFAVIGSVLGKITRNFFAGIRTPWTLANEEVWRRTHQLASKLFVAIGLVVAGAALLDFSWWIMLGALVIAPLIPIVYSYVIYRQVEGAAKA